MRCSCNEFKLLYLQDPIISKYVVNIHQLNVIFLKINIFWASNKQSRYWNWFFDSRRHHLRRHILTARCNEYFMIHYNSNNNAYCRAVNAGTFQTIEHNPVWISILLYTRNPYSYSHFEIAICIYSVRGDIDQMSTNTSSYTICSASNVYMFVYIFIETRIAPLIEVCLTDFMPSHNVIVDCFIGF